MDDFGGKLRQARERRGISLRQIAASTKIAPAALEALERNDISKLPGGIFSRAFVRSYAVEVGLDPDETVREFLVRFNEKEPPTAESIAAHVPEAEIEFENRQRAAARLVKIALVAIPVTALLGYVTWKGRAGETPPQQTAPVTTAAIPQPAPSAADTAAPSAQTPPPETLGAGRLVLDLHPSSNCWVSLTIDGKKLFARVMTAGERASHPVEREAVIEVGDAGAFAFAVNGREGKPLGDKGQVRTLKLTPATAARYLR